MLKNLLIFIMITILFSCQTKSDDIKPSETIISREQFTRDLFQKYDHENYIKWQKLNQLLANDLISAKELGVIDCQGFDRNSEKLVLKQTISYSILDGYFRWNTYETIKGKCIERSINNIGLFFLNITESRVLLSASEGYHFKTQGLKPPTILNKRTILRDLKAMPCGDTVITFVNNDMISTSACEENIFYNGALPNPNPPIYTPFNPPINTHQINHSEHQVKHQSIKDRHLRCRYANKC
ncbi:MAG: hypothetical protein JKY19_14380 [Alcanivoracaceae bacterium]|nr:hypothetical protein [Alcanivoracaceae bacterium]